MIRTKNKEYHPIFILFNNTLTIKGLPVKKKILYGCSVLIPIVLILGFIMMAKGSDILILLIILIPIVSMLRNFIKVPPLLFDIIIRKFPDYILINGKKFLYDDLLFLSMKECENYSIIRLEAKRKNILIANQKILVTDSENFEQALSLSRQLRDFISPDLKINNMTIGNSAPNTTSIYSDDTGGRSSDIEIWHYID